MATSFDDWGIIVILRILADQFPSKFDAVIPKTPVYKGMVV